MTDSPSKTSPATTVVLVHGAWADGSSWRHVIQHLQAQDVPVVAVQNPTSSLADDVEATRKAISNIDGTVVLVGHSWGGTVITEAGEDPKVKALVYVAAFAPDAGQSTGDQVALHDAPPGLSTVEPDRTGALRMTEEGWIRNVAQDLPEEEARVLAAIAPPLALTTFGDKVSKTAWRTRPTWYVVSSDDRAVNVDLQRALARKMEAHTTELASSHMSLISHHQAVADVILAAVDAVD